MNLTKAGDALTVKGFEVTTNFFKAIYDGMALGRDFEPDEDLPGKKPRGGLELLAMARSLWL